MTTTSVGAAQTALFGVGNAEISADEIRLFIAAPGRSNEAVLDAAIENKVSVKQIADAMQGRAGYSASEITSYLKSKGIEPPAGGVDPQPKLDEVLQAEEKARQQAAQLVSDQASARAASVKAERLKRAREEGTLFGKGNDNMSTDQIRQFIAQPNVTNQQILENALEGRVSVQQIMLAMHGQPGWSVGEVRGFLAAQGLNAPDAYWADVEELISVVQGDKGDHSQMSKVLFGDGNSGVSGQQIRDFVKKVMNSGEASEVASLRILEAAVGHKVSVQQLVDAMRGERGWSDQDISQYLTKYGIKAPDESYWTKLETQPKTIFSDEASLKKAGDVLFGMGNGDISPKEIQNFIAQPGLLRRDLLDTALKNNVSVSQILMAMRGKPGWSASEVRAYLSSVGLKASDSYWKDIDALLKVMYGNDKRDYHKALTAVFGDGNPKITDVEIRNLLRETKGSGMTPDDMGSQLLDVAIANNVNVPQVLRAMQGENGWTADNLRKYLAAQGLETTDAYWSGVKAGLPNNVFDGDKSLQDARNTAFGSGNKTLSDADIRAFYDTPRYLDRDSLEAALANGISAEQYIRAMSTSVHWQQNNLSEHLSNVRGYLDSVGLHAPDGYWARMEQMLGVGVLS